ncbi:MAG: LapA family protein [Rhodocyclaceae bacterium]|nr:LapA family protein [Rhodocyclaceae bacterium]
MNALIWLLRGVLFLLLLGLAIKNSSEVELRFFFDASWRAPLSLVVLASIVFGVALCFVALLPRLIRQRRGLDEQRGGLADPSSDAADGASARPALTKR